MKKKRIFLSLFLFSILTFSPTPIMSQNQEAIWTSRFEVYNEKSTFLNMSITPEGKLVVIGRSVHNIDTESIVSFMNTDGVFESAETNDGRIKRFNSDEYKHDFATYDLNGNVYLARSGGSLISRYSLMAIPKTETYIENNISFETSIKIKGMETDPNGNLVIIGNDVIMKYDSVGRNDMSFGDNGVVNVGGNIGAFCIDNQGAVYISTSSENYTYTIKKYTTEGFVDSTFGKEGEVIDKYYEFGNHVTNLKVNHNGDILVLGWYDRDYLKFVTALSSYTKKGIKNYSKIIYSAFYGGGGKPTAISVNSKGEIAISIITTVSINAEVKGYIVRLSNMCEIIDTTQLPFILSRGDNKIVKKLINNDDGTVLVGGTTEVKGGDVITLIRISKNGFFDNQFGKNGIVYISWRKENVEPELHDISVDNKNNIYIMHNQKILKLKNSGIADSSFNFDGVLSVPYVINENSIEIDSTGKVILGGDCQYWDRYYVALVNISSNGFANGINRYLRDYKQGNTITDIQINKEKDIFVLVKRSANYGIAKFSSANVSIFEKDFSTWKPRINVTSITLDKDDKILVSGQLDSKITAFRYNKDGSKDHTFNGTGQASYFESNGYTIKADSKNRVLVSGIYNSNIALTRFNYNGSIDSTFGNNGIVQTPLAIPFTSKKSSKNNFVIDEFGRIIVIGLKASYSNYEITLVRYTEEGTIDSTFGEDGILSNDAGIDNYGELIELDKEGNIIAVGTGVKARIDAEYFPKGYIVIKKYNNTAPVVSVDQKEITEVVTDYSLSQNYPNPFNPTTTIKYSLPNIEYENIRHVQLKIYDVLGNEVETLVNKEQGSGRYEVNFYAKKLSSGVYYYRLTTNSFIKTKKMLILK